MKITSIIRRDETITKEINLPYFCKYEDGKFLKVIDEIKCVEINTSHNYLSLSSFATWVREGTICTSEQCSEEEFNEAYRKVLFEIEKRAKVHELPF